MSLKKKQIVQVHDTNNAALISGGGTWRGLRPCYASFAHHQGIIDSQDDDD